jgi:uncharacterized protein (TIGR03643 family)
MRKNKNTELSYEERERVISLALEERNPFEIIKKDFNLNEQEVLEIMKKKLTADKFDIWKKKAMASKPKPKATKIDDFDEDLEGKYYIKNKFD